VRWSAERSENDQQAGWRHEKEGSLTSNTHGVYRQRQELLTRRILLLTELAHAQAHHIGDDELETQALLGDKICSSH
jgi:hypothetical protein